jgi:phosphate transport system substrate-binding protein
MLISKFASCSRILAGAAAAGLLAVSAAAPAEALVIPGSGSPELVLRRLANAFNATRAGHQVAIPPSSGNAGGIRAVANGNSVMARVSRSLTPAETKAGLSYMGFAKDAVVFAVGAEVKVDALSSGQLADIFAGKVTNWNEVGGTPAPIRLLVRENSDSSLQVIRGYLTPFQSLRFAPRAKLVNHEYEMVAMLDRFGGAIGFLSRSSLADAASTIKALAVDGVAPAPQGLAAGRYAMTIEYGLVYQTGHMTEAARKFANFVFAEGGRRVLTQYGLLPVAGN